jgi:hypothetical protein
MKRRKKMKRRMMVVDNHIIMKEKEKVFGKWKIKMLTPQQIRQYIYNEYKNRIKLLYCISKNS